MSTSSETKNLLISQLKERYKESLYAIYDTRSNNLVYNAEIVSNEKIAKICELIPSIETFPREEKVSNELILFTEFEEKWVLIRKSYSLDIPRPKLLKNVFDLSKDIIAVFDYRGIFKLVNNAVENVLGYTPNQLEGKHYSQFLHDEEKQKPLNTLISEGLTESNQVGVETIFKDVQGRKVYLEWTVQLQPDEKQFYCIARDITSFKLNEKQVHEQRQRVLKVLETIDDPFLFLDPDGYFLYVNDKAKELLQFPEECEGLRLWDVIPESKDSIIYQRFQEAFQNKHGEQFEFFNPDINKWLEVNANYSKFGLIVYFKDLSKKREADEVMQVAYQRYKLLNRVTQDAIWDWDLEKNSLYWNDNFKIVFGYEPSENKSFEQWEDNIHPDDRERVVNSITKVAEKGDRDIWTEEYRFRKSTGEYLYIFDQGFVVKNSTGKVIKMIGAMRDITAVKLNEENLARLNQELLQRTKRLEEFGYITSHNLRGNLSNFLGLLELLDRENLGTEENLLFVEKMDQAAQSMNETLSELLDILVIQSDSKIVIEDVHIPSILNKVLGGVSYLVNSTRAQIHIELNEIENIASNPVYLESIFHNLISNALKYKSPKRIPTIDISLVKKIDHYEISVRDNGLGMDIERHKDRLFRMYQRFHQTQLGKGLGLYLVKSQVTALQGNISVQSEIGKGTTFTLSLPIVNRNES